MKQFVFLLMIGFTLPVLAQDKKAEKKPAVTKKAAKKPAKKAEKKEKTQAQPKQQEWGRFSAQARNDEKERAQKAAAKKK